MRKLLFIITLIPFFANAQQVQYLGTPNTDVRSRGKLSADSGFNLTVRDTICTARFPCDTGDLRVRPQDGKLYIYNGHWENISDVTWNEIVGKPATFPPSPHTHAIADVSGLQAALNGKPNWTDTVATLATRSYVDSRPAGGDTTSALGVQKYDIDNFIGRLVNSTLPLAATAVHPAGFNEFDLIPADDGTGDYEMVFDARTTIKYIRFHDPSELQSKVGTSQERLIYTGQFTYPTIFKEKGRYYVYFHNVSNQIMLIEGNTVDELAAATPRLVYSEFSTSDWSVRKNPRGGYMSAGYINAKACIFTAPLPGGPWKFENYLFFNDVPEENPAYATNQADGMVFAKGDRLFYFFNAFHASRQGIPPVSHPVVMELDKNYKAIGRPVEFIRNKGRAFHSLTDNPNAFAYNPVFIEIEGREEVWYSGSSGSIGAPDTGYIARYQVSSTPITPVAEPGIVAKMRAGDSTDYGTNRKHTMVGTVTNTVAGGFATTSANSGVYNYLNFPYLYEFDISCDFRVGAFPATGRSLIFTIGDKTTHHIALTVDSVGVLRATFNGTQQVTYNVAGTVTLNARTSFKVSVRRQTGRNGVLNGFTNIVINGDGAQTYASNSSYTNLLTYSILNDSTDAVAPARQLNGSVYGLNVTRLVKYEFLENTAAEKFGDFNLLGTGAAYRLRTRKLALTKSDYGYNPGEPGIYNDNALGPTFLPDATTSDYHMSFADIAGSLFIALKGQNVHYNQAAASKAYFGATSARLADYKVQSTGGVSSDKLYIGAGTPNGSFIAEVGGNLLTAGSTSSDDIEITDSTKGIILRSPDGTRYRVTVANGGTLTTTVVP